MEFQQILHKSGISQTKLIREIDNEGESKFGSLGNQVIQTLIQNLNLPVYLQFAITDTLVSVDLNFLEKTVKLDLDSPENIEIFGQLMSCSSVPKIIPRLTVSPVMEAFKLLENHTEAKRDF